MRLCTYANCASLFMICAASAQFFGAGLDAVVAATGASVSLAILAIHGLTRAVAKATPERAAVEGARREALAKPTPSALADVPPPDDVDADLFAAPSASTVRSASPRGRQ